VVGSSPRDCDPQDSILILFFRYTSVQFIAFIFDLVLFSLFLKIGLFDPLFSNILSKLITGFFAFFSHRKFSFQMTGNVFSQKQAVNYIYILGINIPISTIFLKFALVFFSNSLVAKFFSEVVLFVCNFTIAKYFIFKKDNLSGDS